MFGFFAKRFLLAAGLLVSGQQTAWADENQTISFTTEAPTNAVYQDTYLVAASATSGLEVTLSILPESYVICTLAGGVITFDNAGTCNIIATQAGQEGSYNAAESVTQSITVGKRPQTIAFTSNPASNLVVGGTYEPVAVAESGLPVSYFIETDSSGVCELTPTLRLSLFGAGICIIYANQEGDENWAAANSNAVYQVITVLPANTAPIADAGQPQTVAPGDDVTLSGSGIDPEDGSTVTYEWTEVSGFNFDEPSSANPYFTAPGLNEGELTRLLAFQLIVRDSQDLASAPAFVNITVKAAPKPQSISFNTAPVNPLIGDTYTPNATTTSNLPVTFSIDFEDEGSCALVPQSSPQQFRFFKEGSCYIYANQAGNEEWAAAERAFQLINVSRKPQIITFQNPGDTEFVLNGTFELAATSTGSDSDIVFSSQSTQFCTVEGATVTMVDVGTCRLMADKAGDVEYLDAETAFADFELFLTNKAPVADAGEPQTVLPGETVTLNAFNSSDPDAGDTIESFNWQAPNGIAFDPLVVAPYTRTFIAPALNDGETTRDLVFTLTVNDGELDSEQDSVTITVKAPLTPQTITFDPQAPQGLTVGSTYTPSATASSGLPVTFSISNLGTVGACAFQNSPTELTMLKPGNCTIKASQVGNDEYAEASYTDLTILVAAANIAPVATIDPSLGDPSANSGDELTLFGSGSDLDGEIAGYQWTATNGATLANGSTARPTLTAPTLAPGAENVDVVISLVVTDNLGLQSEPDTYTITIYAPDADNIAPIANAGPDQTVASGAEVTLSGSGQDDGTIASYAWIGPIGTTLTGGTTATPYFTAPTLATGAADIVLKFLLVVTDDLGLNSQPASVTIIVKATAPANSPPLAVTNVPNRATLGQTTILIGDQSLDPDGKHTLIYNWKIYDRRANIIFESSDANANFTPQNLDTGNYTWIFTVIDHLGLKNAKTGNIYVQNAPVNIAPVANAGPTQTVASGATVTLDASGSTDVELTALSFAWVSNNGMILSDAAAQKPTFVAPVVAVGSPNLALSFEVTVTDGGGLQSKATSSVIVIANPGSVALQKVVEKVANKVSEVSTAVTLASTSDAIYEAFEENSTDGSSIGAYTDGVRVDLSGRFASPAAKAIDELALKGRDGMRERSGGSIPGLFAYDGSGSAAADAVDPKRWSVWGSARVSQLVTSAASNDLGGNQYNFNGGATYRINPNLVVGALGGYETFKYSDNIGSKFSGSGYTGGVYAGWRPDGGLRFDGQVSATRLGYDVGAGVVTGSYSATRIQASVGVTGSLTAASVLFEPSVRATGTWEQQAAYKDSLGTAFASKSSSSGSVSAGLKASKKFVIDADTSITPFASVLGNYRFAQDTASAVANASNDFSARIGVGFNANLNSSTTLGVDGSLSGLGLEDTLIWSLKTKLGIAF